MNEIDKEDPEIWEALYHTQVFSEFESNMLMALRDNEVQILTRKYKEISGKNSPPYNCYRYEGIEDYKQKLREKVAMFKSK